MIDKTLAKQAETGKSILILVPLLGTVLFAVLYIIATFLYPGGSQIDRNSKGFSWANNYWCNLLNDRAINGQPNPSKPIAMTGMFVLCLALSLFWLQFPHYFKVGKFTKLTIQYSGVSAMVIAFFLFSNNHHDLITNLASVFGLIATVGTFYGLYKNKKSGLFYWGTLIILLVGINNYVYYSKELLVYLPVIQKITFATFLTWICVINIQVYQMAKN